MTQPRRALGAAVVAVAVTFGAVATSLTAHAAYRDPTMDLPRSTSPFPGVGPHRPYVQEIMINTVVPLVNEAIINPTAHGYVFRAGQQDTDLTMTQVDGRLRFVDTGSRSWKWLPRACRRLDVPRGVGATCAIGARFTQAEPMLVEVWPRLGDDVVDSTALSAQFDVSFLGDRGDDVAYFGAGDDFFNGAQDDDRVYGGAGRDWLRTGDGADFLHGGAGADHLVGVAGADTLHGGAGDDRLYGLDGNDVLRAGTGQDSVSCGRGVDTAFAQVADRAVACERLSRS